MTASGLRPAARSSTPISAPIPRDSCSEKSVGRTRQAEIFAQRLALVFAPEKSATLQFRHHTGDEVIEPARQIGKHHGKAIACIAEQPFFHLVGDRLRRA